MAFPIFRKHNIALRNIPFRDHYPLLFLICLLAVSLIVTNPAHGQKEFYSIHLGIYHTDDNARDRVEHLKNLGHNAFYRHDKDDKDNDIFKIYIEKYASREEAEKEAGVLKELGLISNYNIEALDELSKSDLPDTKPDELLAGHCLQVASMREKTNAQEMVERFKRSGYRALYRPESVEGKGLWYRVYIYGYETRTEAEKDAKKLLHSGMISGYTHPSFLQTKSGGNSFFIHVSSFKEKENARHAVQSLRKRGLKAFVVDEEVAGADWFRVYIGEFKNETEARKKGSELMRKGIIDYYKPLEVDRKRVLE